jgi:hypothetical protein
MPIVTPPVNPASASPGPLSGMFLSVKSVRMSD